MAALANYRVIDANQTTLLIPRKVQQPVGGELYLDESGALRRWESYVDRKFPRGEYLTFGEIPGYMERAQAEAYSMRAEMNRLYDSMCGWRAACESKAEEIKILRARIDEMEGAR